MKNSAIFESNLVIIVKFLLNKARDALNLNIIIVFVLITNFLRVD